MKQSVATTFDPATNAHVVTISPPYAAVDITVHIDQFDHLYELPELYLYHFDVDSNAIEFAFGEKVQHLAEHPFVQYSTDPEVQVPPFRIQITHQVAQADLSRYAFTVSWALRY